LAELFVIKKFIDTGDSAAYLRCFRFFWRDSGSSFLFDFTQNLGFKSRPLADKIEFTPMGGEMSYRQKSLDDFLT
jgi:hypothetical protein